MSSLIDRVIDSDHHDPFQVLGLHFVENEPKMMEIQWGNRISYIL